MLCSGRVSQINKSNQIPFPFCSQLIELSILSDLDHLLSNMRMDSRLTREVTKEDSREAEQSGNEKNYLGFKSIPSILTKFDFSII